MIMNMIAALRQISSIAKHYSAPEKALGIKILTDYEKKQQLIKGKK